MNKNDTVCHHVYSVWSFQSSVPYDLEDGMEPAHGGSIQYTQVNQRTNHIFNSINRFTYYQFELRIQASLGTTNARTYNHYSFLHFFGVQIQARVTEPVTSHSVIRAHVEDPVIIPCSGAGIPSPAVCLQREVGGQPPHLCGGDNIIYAVSEVDAGEHFCVSVNTLVSYV